MIWVLSDGTVVDGSEVRGASPLAEEIRAAFEYRWPVEHEPGVREWLDLDVPWQVDRVVTLCARLHGATVAIRPFVQYPVSLPSLTVDPPDAIY